ncbi:glycosyltransferase [Kitasatospora aburaviensis]
MTDARRVFVFSREYPPTTVGGTSTVARNLAAGLVAEGWEAVVVTSRPGAAEDLRERVDGVTVHRVGTEVVYNAGSGLADDSLLIHRRFHRAAEALAAELGAPRWSPCPTSSATPRQRCSPAGTACRWSTSCSRTSARSPRTTATSTASPAG